MQIRPKVNRLLPDKAGRLFMRTAAGILSFVMLFVMLFSITFIAVESDHDCSGEDCAICACIDECEKTIVRFRNISVAGMITIAAVKLLVLLSAAVSFKTDNDRKTPISDKIQLNI